LLGEKVQAVNMETDEPLRTVAAGSFALPIKKHDVAFVLVE